MLPFPRIFSSLWDEMSVSLRVEFRAPFHIQCIVTFLVACWRDYVCMWRHLPITYAAYIWSRFSLPVPPSYMCILPSAVVPVLARYSAPISGQLLTSAHFVRSLWDLIAKPTRSSFHVYICVRRCVSIITALDMRFCFRRTTPSYLRGYYRHLSCIRLIAAPRLRVL